MEHPAHLSCDAVSDKASMTTFRNAVCKDLHAAHERISDVFRSYPDKAEVSAPVSGRSRGIPVVNTEESMSEKKSRATSNETPARVVAARSQSCGKAPAGPQEDVIVASQSNVAPERNAQYPSINVITQSDSQQTSSANKRGTTRSSSPNRRITRAMSASQQPRVNVFAMKSAATVPIFSGTSKENFHAFVRNFKDHVRLTREPDDREVRNHLLTVLTDFARDTAEEALDRNPDASSDEIIDALRAQYEDQYSTQHRLDAIKACFQYAQEPVQDYYQRVRKLMREAQTGANRSEVIQVAKEAFRTGLQSDIRFYVTTARSTEFDQIYKDAIFFEKALQDKERKERADAAVIANRPRAAEVFAQAALRHQGQFYDYEDDEQSFYPAVAALNPRSGNNRPGYQQRTPGVAFNNNAFSRDYNPNRDFNTSQNFSRSFDQVRNRNIECWYCGLLGHYRQDCRKRAADMARGACRNRIGGPHNAPPRQARSRNLEPRRPPMDPVENHQQPTVRVLQQPFSPETQEAQSRIEQQERTIKMQENQLNDIKWRLEAYQMGRSPGNSPPPSVNVTSPTVSIAGQISAPFITAQIPIRANGRPCHALIIGPFKIEHLTHFTEGRCTPTGPTDYTFIIGNDLLSQLPKFVFDYSKGRFLIGGAILPMGNQYESGSSPENQMVLPEEQIACVVHDNRSTSTLFPSRTSPTAPPKQPSTTVNDPKRRSSIDTPSRQRRVTPKVVQSTETDDTIQQNLCGTRRKPVRTQN
uniref:CCHC-type domain-containing protein n=1 Tax=Caenorhabditis japonica TaxID=281687 RepID=A0A8R1ECI7_CAEJA